MATVHPSRMGLVPQDSKEYRSSRYRSRSRGHSRDRNMVRRRSPSQGRDSGRDSGRRSPMYDGYKAASDSAPWRKQENMYPNRGNGGNRYLERDWGSDGYLTSRQQQRENIQFTIWPPSPKGPMHVSPVRRSKSHRRTRKRDRSPSTSYSDDTSSEEERRRREKKARKKAKEKEKDERRSQEERRHERHRSSENGDGSGSRGRSEDRLHTKRSVSHTHSGNEEDDEEEWVEKGASSTAFVPVPASNVQEVPVPYLPPAPSNADDSDIEVGPQPLTKTSTSKVDERSYGSALLRGEGSAMAAFLAEDTNARIPRRGEIGLTSDEIASYEDVGYVMSGSRHRRMNAVRMRKENQVISAEEKRGILKLQREERERREELLREEFKELVDERLKAGGKT